MRYPVKENFDEAIASLDANGVNTFISMNFNRLKRSNRNLYTFIQAEISDLCLSDNEYSDLRLCLSILLSCFKDYPKVSVSVIETLSSDLYFLAASERIELDQSEKYEEDDRGDAIRDKEQKYKQEVLRNADDYIDANFKGMFGAFHSYVRSRYITIHRCAMEISKILILAINYEQSREGIAAQVDDILGRNKSGP